MSGSNEMNEFIHTSTGPQGTARLFLKYTGSTVATLKATPVRVLTPKAHIMDKGNDIRPLISEQDKEAFERFYSEAKHALLCELSDEDIAPWH